MGDGLKAFIEESRVYGFIGINTFPFKRAAKGHSLMPTFKTK